MNRGLQPVLTCLFALACLALLAFPLMGQTVTVTTAADDVDIDWQTATIADLPGPDGKVSLSEALIATNHTPGHQTIGFAVPAEEWPLQFLLPGRAVFTTVTGYFWRANDEVTIDGTTQTAFTGDTNPDGHEVALYGSALYLNADNSTLIGFDSSSVSLSGSNGVIEGNTGSMNINLFGGSGSLIKDNEGGTIKIDRSSDNVVVGNVVSRVRVLGWDPPAANNRVGGPDPADRNIIYGYGTYNSEGLPSGSAVQIFYTSGTVIENNWIGTADGLTIGNLACTMGVSIETQNDDLLIKDNLISGIYGLGVGPHYPGTVWGRGILASGAGSGLTITGNVIGPDINGDPTLGGAWGLDFGDPVTHPLSMTGIVVSDNDIGGHILNGVTVGRNTAAVRLAGNAIRDNGWLGIDLIPSGYGYGVSPNDPLDVDTGGSGVQNFPDIGTVMRVGADLHVTGTFHSSALDDFTLEFFASAEADDSGHGEGELPLGTTAVTTDAAGNAAFDVTLPGPVPAGWVITATATLEPLGATSEFSAVAATCWRDEGYALSGASGAPRLIGQGDLSPLSDNALRLRNAAPSAVAGLFAATSGDPTPFMGGTLVPLPLLMPPVLLMTDADGEVAIPFTMPDGAPAGLELWLQWGILDAAAFDGVALSNALVGTLP